MVSNVACGTCGGVTSYAGFEQHSGDRRCARCESVERHLVEYLRRGGEKARAFVLSCLTGIALCFVLPGCGGAPFSFPQGYGADAGPDAEIIGDPTPDGGAADSTPDAGDPPDAAADAVPEAAPESDAGPPAVDAAPDAPAACTKAPLATTPRDLCPGETGNRVFPMTYIRAGAAGDCSSIAGFFATPEPCACAETFTCACLLANLGGTPSCATVAGVPWIY